MSEIEAKGATYRDAGVDLDAADGVVGRLARLAAAAGRPEVLAGVGGFGGCFSLEGGGYRRPVLVAGADGVGTKLKVAFLTGRHDTVGIDCVAMCANDVAVMGAEPLFFLDYLAVGRLDPAVVEAVVSGVAEGCRRAGCALLGGETAELPGFYASGEYDLAGFCVGAAERERLLDGSAVRAGDAVVGVASSGLHSNGYSLARRVLLDAAGWTVDRHVPELGCTLGEALLEPTRIYARPLLELLATFNPGGAHEGDGAPAPPPIRTAAHITGGGLVGNLPRVLPGGLGARLERAWPEPPIFELIRRLGRIEPAEMARVFNLGLGLVLVVAPDAADAVCRHLGALGERAWIVGEVVTVDPGAAGGRVTIT